MSKPKAGEVRWATKKGFHGMWPPERMLLYLYVGMVSGELIGRNVITNHLHDLDDFWRFSEPVVDPKPIRKTTQPRKAKATR